MKVIICKFHESKDDQYYFTLESRGESGGDRVLATSETYKNLGDCLYGAGLITGQKFLVEPDPGIKDRVDRLFSKFLTAEETRG